MKDPNKAADISSRVDTLFKNSTAETKLKLKKHSLRVLSPHRAQLLPRWI
jgi:hypothetical protein